jgi:hypothetical protein
MAGGGGRRRRRRRGSSTGRGRKRGGMGLGGIISQAAVPFSLLAMQQNYGTRGRQTEIPTRRQRRRNTFRNR